MREQAILQHTPEQEAELRRKIERVNNFDQLSQLIKAEDILSISNDFNVAQERFTPEELSEAVNIARGALNKFDQGSPLKAKLLELLTREANTRTLNL